MNYSNVEPGTNWSNRDIISDWKTNAITSFEKNNAMRLCAVRKFFFLRKDFNYHTNRTNRRSPMIWSRLSALQAFTL